MAEPDEDVTLADLYDGCINAGHDKTAVVWRWRLAKCIARKEVAKSQLARLTTREAAGLPTDMAEVHGVEQELADAAGSEAFCREYLRAPLTGPKPQQPNGGKKP